VLSRDLSLSLQRALSVDQAWPNLTGQIILFSVPAEGQLVGVIKNRNKLIILHKI